MKNAALIVSLLVGVAVAFGQTIPKIQRVYKTKADCAQVTQRIIEQMYNYDMQLTLNATPEKLACLDYLYARSYDFAPGQTVLRSQKALINVENYKSLRHSTHRVTVYDEAAQVTIVLYSWNEVEQEMANIRLSYELASCE